MILGIDQITYGAGDLDTCRRFFADWGLSLVDDRGDQLVFESLNGCRVVVADPARVALPAPIEEGPTLREVTWGVRDAASLDDLRARLAGAAGFDDAGDSIGAVDPNGLAIRFRGSTKRSVAVEGARSNTWDRRDRIDQPAPIYERATPVEVGHVVFFVADVPAVEAFYANLGFVTSDRYPGRGAFMRCDARGGHHDLFLLRTPDGKRGLNHVAFTVRDIHEVFGGGLAFGAKGHETQLGPGRHPISSAYFWYFKNPAGGLIEYYADEDQLTEAWQPREFEPGPTVFAEWAIDGGIDGRTRRQKGHEAGGKFLTEKPRKDTESEPRSTRMSNWTDVGERASVEPDTPLAATVGGVAVGVYDVEGELHAIEDICPHAHAHLSEGFVEGCEVECPLHAAVFDVRTGKHLRGELCRDVKTFPVRVVEGRVQVEG